MGTKSSLSEIKIKAMLEGMASFKAATAEFVLHVNKLKKSLEGLQTGKLNIDIGKMLKLDASSMKAQFDKLGKDIQGSLNRAIFGATRRPGGKMTSLVDYLKQLTGSVSSTNFRQFGTDIGNEIGKGIVEAINKNMKLATVNITKARSGSNVRQTEGAEAKKKRVSETAQQMAAFAAKAQEKNSPDASWQGVINRASSGKKLTAGISADFTTQAEIYRNFLSNLKSASMGSDVIKKFRAEQERLGTEMTNVLSTLLRNQLLAERVEKQKQLMANRVALLNYDTGIVPYGAMTVQSSLQRVKQSIRRPRQKLIQDQSTIGDHAYPGEFFRGSKENIVDGEFYYANSPGSQPRVRTPTRAQRAVAAIGPSATGASGPIPVVIVGGGGHGGAGAGAAGAGAAGAGAAGAGAAGAGAGGAGVGGGGMGLGGGGGGGRGGRAPRGPNVAGAARNFVNSIVPLQPQSMYESLQNLAGNALSGLGTIIKTLTGLTLGATAAFVGFGYAVKSFGSDVLMTTEKMRGYNIALMGMMKDQGSVSRIMEASFKATANMPVAYDQVFQATKAMSLISPLRPYLKDAKTLDSTMADVWTVVMGLSQIEPEWGIQGAFFSLREALSGDMLSLKRRFEMPVDVFTTDEGIPITQIKGQSSKVLKVLAKELGNLMPASALEMTSKQFGAVLMKMEGFYTQFKAMIGEYGMYDIIVGDLRKVQDFLQDFVNSPEAREFALGMSNAFANAWKASIDIVVGTLQTFNKMFGSIFNLGSVNGAIQSSIDVLNKYVIALKTIGAVVNDKEVQAAVVGVWDTLLDRLSEVKDFVKDTITALINDFNRLMKFLAPWMDSVGGGGKKKGGDLLGGRGLFYLWLFGTAPLQVIVSGITSVIAGLTLLVAIGSKLQLLAGAGAAGAGAAGAAAAGGAAAGGGLLSRIFGPVSFIAKMTATTIGLYNALKDLYALQASIKAEHNQGVIAGLLGTDDKGRYETFVANVKKVSGVVSKDPVLQKEFGIDGSEASIANLMDSEGESSKLAVKLKEWAGKGLSGVSSTYNDAASSVLIAHNALGDDTNRELATKAGKQFQGSAAQYGALDKEKSAGGWFSPTGGPITNWVKDLLGFGDAVGVAGTSTAKQIKEATEQVNQAVAEGASANLSGLMIGQMQRIMGVDSLNTSGIRNDGSSHEAGNKLDIGLGHGNIAKLNSPEKIQEVIAVAKALGVTKILAEDVSKKSWMKPWDEAGFGAEGIDVRGYENAKATGPHLHMEFGKSTQDQVFGSGTGLLGQASQTADLITRKGQEAYGKQGITNFDTTWGSIFGEMMTTIESFPTKINLAASKVKDIKSQTRQAALSGEAFDPTNVIKAMWGDIGGISGGFSALFDRFLDQVGKDAPAIVAKVFPEAANASPAFAAIMEVAARTLSENFGLAIAGAFSSKYEEGAKLSDAAIAQQKWNRQLGINESDIIGQTSTQYNFAGDSSRSFGYSLAGSMGQTVSRGLDNTSLEIYNQRIGSYKQMVGSGGRGVGETVETLRGQTLADIMGFGTGGNLNPSVLAASMKFLEFLDKISSKVAKSEAFMKFAEANKQFMKALDELNPDSVEGYRKLFEQLGSVSRESRGAFFTSVEKSLEFAPRSTEESLMLGAASSVSEFKNWSETMYGIGKQLVTDLQSTFENSFFDTMTGKLANLADMFRNILTSIRDMIYRTFAKLAAQQVINVLFNVGTTGNSLSMGQSGGGPMGIVGQVLGMGGGQGGMGGQSSGGGGVLGSLGGLWQKTQYGTTGLGQVASSWTGKGKGLDWGGYAGAAMGAKVATSGWGPMGLFGKAGLGNKAWSWAAANPLLAGGLAAGAFLSQPGRLFGGTVDHTGQARELQNQYASDRAGYLSRRSDDAMNYYSSAGQVSNYGFGTDPLYWETKSGDGIFSKKTKTGHTDASAFTSSLKGYYEILESSAKTHAQNMRNVDKLREKNEFAAVMQELKYKRDYLSVVQVAYNDAFAKSDWKKVDELRDKLVGAEDDVIKLQDNLSEIVKALSYTKLEYQAFMAFGLGKNEVEYQKALLDVQKKKIDDLVPETEEWYRAQMDLLTSQKQLSDELQSKAKEIYDSLKADKMALMGNEFIGGMEFKTFGGALETMASNRITASGGIDPASGLKFGYNTGSAPYDPTMAPGYVGWRSDGSYSLGVTTMTATGTTGPKLMSGNMKAPPGGTVSTTTGQFSGISQEDYLRLQDIAYETLIKNIQIAGKRNQVDYEKGNLFSSANKIMFDAIDRTKLVIGRLSSDTVEYWDAQLQYTEQQKQLAGQIKQWVEGGFLPKVVMSVFDYTREAFTNLGNQVRSQQFKQSILGTAGGFSDQDSFNVFGGLISSESTKAQFNKIFSQMNGMGVAVAPEMQQISNYINQSRFTDTWDAMWEYNLNIVKSKINNITDTSSDEYFNAQEELFKLLAEKSDRLKQKADEATNRMEEMLSAIEKTVKIRIAEEGKTRRGDVIFMDTRSTQDMMTEIRNLAKAGDPAALTMIDTLLKRLGMRN